MKNNHRASVRTRFKAAELSAQNSVGSGRNKAIVIAFMLVLMLLFASVAFANSSTSDTDFDEPVNELVIEEENEHVSDEDATLVAESEDIEDYQLDESLYITTTDEADSTDTEIDTASVDITTQANVNVTSSTTSWKAGNTYIVDGNVDISSRISVATGNAVTLQLDDGAVLNANSGINVPEKATLIIQGNGELNASSSSADNAVIGSNSGKNAGKIIIRSGVVNVSKNAWSYAGAGIGTGKGGVAGEIVIEGGEVTVSSFYGSGATGAAIGGGETSPAGSIVISGGHVIASSHGSAPAIGSSRVLSPTDSIIISGGIVEARGNNQAPAIGTEFSGEGKFSLTVSGGTLIATSGSFSAINGIDPSKFQVGDTSGTPASSAILKASSINSKSLPSDPDWNGIVFIGDEGAVYGNALLSSDLIVSASQTFSIPSSSSLEISSGVTLQDEGTITNEGTILNNGSILGSGSFVNAGSIEPNVIFFPQSITFDTDGGSEIASVSVNRDSMIAAPEPDPTRNGYRFDGWYKNASCDEPWDFETDIVTEPVTLYAKWTKECTVTFVTEEGEGVSEMVYAGELLHKPSNPEREGYRFDGWYKDDAFTEPWNFESDPVEEDVTLYAKWIPDSSSEAPSEPEIPGYPEDQGEPEDPGISSNPNQTEQGSTAPSDDHLQEDELEDSGAVKLEKDSSKGYLPQLGDALLVLPIFFGALSVLIATNLDTLSRLRSRRH